MKHEDCALARYPENMRQALRLLATVVSRLYAEKADVHAPFSSNPSGIRVKENGGSANKGLL